jgi:hypothetical protein
MALSNRGELCKDFWHSAASLEIVLRIYLASSLIIQWNLGYSECWDVKSGRGYGPVLVYRVFIGGSIFFPMQKAVWGLFDLLSGFHLNLLQYKWFLRDVCGFCEMVQAMNFFSVSAQGLAVHLEADLAPRSIRLSRSNGWLNRSVNDHYCKMWGKVSCQNAWYSGDKWILLRRSQSFPRSGEVCKVL